MTEASENKYATSGETHIAYRVVGEDPIDIVLIADSFSHVEAAWGERHSRAAGSGIAFADRGSHKLKGVADEWQLYSVVG
jgi:hypothetical protein